MAILTEDKLKELDEAVDGWTRWTGPGRLVQKDTLRALIDAARELDEVRRVAKEMGWTGYESEPKLPDWLYTAMASDRTDAAFMTYRRREIEEKLREAVRRGCSCDVMNGFTCNMHELLK